MCMGTLVGDIHSQIVHSVTHSVSHSLVSHSLSLWGLSSPDWYALHASSQGTSGQAREEDAASVGQGGIRKGTTATRLAETPP